MVVAMAFLVSPPSSNLFTYPPVTNLPNESPQEANTSSPSKDPSGIRFGSSEIYAITESPPFNTLFTNTLCVGRRRPSDPDEAVFLFVVLSPTSPIPSLTPALRSQLKTAIRNGLSARHVPKFMFEVPEVPVTINGKVRERRKDTTQTRGLGSSQWKGEQCGL